MAKNLHLKRFDGGRRTPQQYHTEFAFSPNARCSSGCGRRPEVRAIVMCPFDEAVKRNMLPEGAMFNPEIMKLIVTVNEGGKPKPYVRISVTYACKSCQAEMEKAMAKGPSWCIVDIQRGPDPTNKVQVGLT